MNSYFSMTRSKKEEEEMVSNHLRSISMRINYLFLDLESLEPRGLLSL
jgi:hypothetical protein